jgi:FeS assembly protein IscX
MSDELNWDHTNRIGVLLTDAHPKTEPHTVALSDLHGYVTALSDFKGDPKHFHEPTLEAIRDAWSTEFQERTRNWA